MRNIIFSDHCLISMKKRNVTKEEVIETISKNEWEAAKHNRFSCKNNFLYKKTWNKKYYETKQVVPIFIEENNNIVVITVFTFYY